MRESSEKSPFAALDSREQLGRWRALQTDERAAREMLARLPKLHENTEEEAPVAQMRQMPQQTRHSQYDAVINRMKNAQRKTGDYRSWLD